MSKLTEYQKKRLEDLKAIREVQSIMNAKGIGCDIITEANRIGETSIEYKFDYYDIVRKILEYKERAKGLKENDSEWKRCAERSVHLVDKLHTKLCIPKRKARKYFYIEHSDIPKHIYKIDGYNKFEYDGETFVLSDKEAGLLQAIHENFRKTDEKKFSNIDYAEHTLDISKMFARKKTIFRLFKPLSKDKYLLDIEF